MRSKNQLRRWLTKPESAQLWVVDGGCRGIAQSQVCLGLTPKQKSLRLPGESSLIEFGPCSSLGGLLSKSVNIPYITKKAARLV